MNTPDFSALLIPESSYDAEMAARAEPALAACRQELRLQREPGRDIFCVRYRPDQPRGVVLISHGFTETAEKYREMAYYFLQAGYAVYIPDHCGHGRSYRLTEDLSLVHVDRWERYREDLLFAAQAAAEQNPGLPLFLYGHSMGGGIAAAAAAREPDRFRKLILSSPMIRPLTGGVPWALTRLLCAVLCACGRQDRYVMGQGPWKGEEKFEDSASVSEPRFAYYSRRRCSDSFCQMNGASYGWLRSACRLSGELLDRSWKTIACPVLLFQAEQDAFVDLRQQEVFASRLAAGSGVKLVRCPGTKHEIYNSHDDTLRTYYETIFSFLAG